MPPGMGDQCVQAVRGQAGPGRAGQTERVEDPGRPPAGRVFGQYPVFDVGMVCADPRTLERRVETVPGLVEALCVDSSCRLGLVLSVVIGLVFVGRDVADRRVEAVLVEPVDPFRGGEFNVGETVPGPTGLDQLRLVEADLGFHERVVQGVADAADGGVVPASRR